MFIAKKDGLIVMASDNESELKEKLKYILYDSIEESKEEYFLYKGKYLTKIELNQQKRKELDSLSLTRADVERAIYKSKNIDFDDILNLVKDNPDINLKALKIELKANNFYRGNPYINQIGSLLGFTQTQLDNFFKTGDWEELIKSND